jgi:hypothetical protein
MRGNPVRREAIQHYLATCRQLSQFCTQNGWIDDESVTYEVEAVDASSALVAVRFTEVIMEGSGCVADRIACFGKLRLFFDETGTIRASEIA